MQQKYNPCIQRYTDRVKLIPFDILKNAQLTHIMTIRKEKKAANKILLVLPSMPNFISAIKWQTTIKV